MPNMSEVLNAFDLIKKPSSVFGKKEWPGLWKGRVEDVNDPEKRGRIKVRVTGVHPENSAVPVNHLPWAEPCFPDTGFNFGDFHVPYRLGDWVFVMFLGGHPDFPVWIGGWYGQNRQSKVSETPEEVRNPRYPHRRIIKTRRGHKIELSDEMGEMEIKITDIKGNFVWFDTETNTMKVYWKGDKEEIITGDYTLCVDRDFKVRVGRHNYEQVVSNKSTKVGGSETIGVGGSMYHYTGETIYHNSGGSAQNVSRLPNPANTVQERRPAFPSRTATLSRVASACGVPSTKITRTISAITAVASKNLTTADVLETGIETISQQVKNRKTAGTTPTVANNARTQNATAKAAVDLSRVSYNKALVDMQRLLKQGAPISDAYMENAKSIADDATSLSDSLVTIDSDYATAIAALSLVPPDIETSSQTLDSIRAQTGMASVNLDGIRSDVTTLKSNLRSIQSGRELNISDGQIATQVKKYNTAIIEGHLDDTLTELDNAELELTNANNNVTYCVDHVDEQISNTDNTLTNILGSFSFMLEGDVDDASQLFTMVDMILDVTQEPSITTLLNYISAEMGGATYPEIRTSLTDTPSEVLSSVVGFMQAIRYNEMDETARTLVAGFGPLSDIDVVAATHGFGAPLLATIANLKTADTTSIKSMSSVLATEGTTNLKNLSDALLAVSAGHMGRIYDVANDITVPGLNDYVARIDAAASATVVEKASTGMGKKVTVQGVKTAASQIATLASRNGGYPLDDPIIRLPDGAVVSGLIDG